jgi:hypothetical protein
LVRGYNAAQLPFGQDRNPLAHRRANFCDPTTSGIGGVFRAKEG